MVTQLKLSRRKSHRLKSLTVLGLALSIAPPIALADIGTLWIGADPFNSSTGILNTTVTGTVLHSIDPLGNGGLGNGIAVDVPDNLLYVSDEGTMQKVNLTTLADIGGPIAQSPGGSLPEDMTFDPATGRMWRTDYGLGQVNLIDPATNTVISHFSVSTSPVSGPVGIAFDGTDLWVGGFNNNRLERFTTAGVDTGTGFTLGAGFVGIGFNELGGVAYDPIDNTLYLGTGNRVYHYDLVGNQLGFFNTPDPGSGRNRFVDGLEFEDIPTAVPEPSGIAWLAAGFAVVAGVFRRVRR